VLDAVNATHGQEELLKLTRDDYFTLFITREDQLYGEPNLAMIGHDGLEGLLRSKVIVLASRFRRHFTRDAGNLNATRSAV
jgi:hypothetical protein